MRTINAGYLSAMGVPMLTGRGFDGHDVPGATHVVLINQHLARLAFPGQDPVGKQVEFLWSGGPLQVAGVAADENTTSLDSDIRPVVYFPSLQDGATVVNLVVRSAVAPAQLSRSNREETRPLDPEAKLNQIKTMQEVIADSPAMFTRRYPALLMGLFAAIALVMAGVGTYGLVSYAVTQRTHEIGIRIALGAQNSDILRLVVGQGMLLVLAGVEIGLIGAAVLSHALDSSSSASSRSIPAPTLWCPQSFLWCCSPGYIPARRAVKVGPAVALGAE